MSQQAMFKGMYNALQRAKQILISLIQLLGMDADDDEGGDEEVRQLLGKRQRKE